MHFLYGLGAIALLVAALSTVLEWKYARQLFAAGVIVEILVFIVSLIDIPPSESDRTEEIVFPPNQERKNQSDAGVETKSEPESELRQILSSINRLGYSFDELKSSQESLKQGFDTLKDEYRGIKRTSQLLSRDINELKDKSSVTSRELEKMKKKT
jgi:archaellum component FlaC